MTVTKLMPTAGLERMAELITLDTPYIAVGTSTTTPDPTDTTLVAETDRLAATTVIRTSKTAEIRAFFLNSQLPTTVEEIGLFLDGTASVDTGDLLVRGLSSFTKGSQDMLAIVKVTVAEL